MSLLTTNLGPRVSLVTVASDAGPAHLFLDSNTSLTIAGKQFASNATSASLTSAILADGEIRIGAVSAGTATLFFRSGVTTYSVALPGSVL